MIGHIFAGSHFGASSSNKTPEEFKNGVQTPQSPRSAKCAKTSRGLSWINVFIISIISAQFIIVPCGASACVSSGLPSGLCMCMSKGFSYRSCASQFHKRSNLPPIGSFPQGGSEQYHFNTENQQQLQQIHPTMKRTFAHQFQPPAPSGRSGANNEQNENSQDQQNGQWPRGLTMRSTRNFDLTNREYPQFRDTLPSQYNFY